MKAAGPQEALDGPVGRPRDTGPVGEPAIESPGPGLDMDVAAMASDQALGARAIDRSHNRDVLSSEAMTEMLRDLQDSLAAAEERVSGLETARGRLSAESRALALGVAAMGDTLSRRVRALETAAPSSAPAAPPPPPAAPIRPSIRKPEPTLRPTVALAVLLLFVLAAFWLLGAGLYEKAPPAHPIAPTAARLSSADPRPISTPPSQPAPVHSAAPKPPKSKPVNDET